ncbi:MAG: YfhO family protein, partial [Fidelibacterota bacterium]
RGFVGGTMAFIWLTVKEQLPIKVFASLVLVLAVVDYWVVDREFMDLKPKRNITAQFRATPSDNYLKDHIGNYRILPVDNSNTNRYVYFGIPSVSGYRPVKLRTYQDLLDAKGLNQLPVLNMLNVKYLVSSKTISHPRFQSVFTQDKNIYQNLDVLPKAWFVSSVSPDHTPAEALKVITSPDFNPSETAILETRWDEASDSVNIGTVTIVDSNPEAMKFITDNTGPGFMVVSEMYYPDGLTATVDGKETPIFKTNFVLRGIVVPAGKHTIVFSYRDPYRTITSILSTVSTLFVLLILGWTYYKERKATHAVA